MATANVSVVHVELDWVPGLDYLQYDCGHAEVIGHDEANESLVGAQTDCERHFDAARTDLSPCCSHPESDHDDIAGCIGTGEGTGYRAGFCICERRGAAPATL